MRLYEFKIGYRYTRGAKNKFASFSSWMSMLGVIIGVTSLIITLSVMNGFKLNTVNKILSKMSHISISTNNELEIKNLSKIEDYLSKEYNSAIVIVTHDKDLANRCSRSVLMANGIIS